MRCTSTMVYLCLKSGLSPNSRCSVGMIKGFEYACWTISSSKLWGCTPMATSMTSPASSPASSPPSQRIVYVSDNAPVLLTAVEVNNSMVDGAGEAGREGYGVR